MRLLWIKRKGRYGFRSRRFFGSIATATLIFLTSLMGELSMNWGWERGVNFNM